MRLAWEWRDGVQQVLPRVGCGYSPNCEVRNRTKKAEEGKMDSLPDRLSWNTDLPLSWESVRSQLLVASRAPLGSWVFGLGLELHQLSWVCS